MNGKENDPLSIVIANHFDAKDRKHLTGDTIARQEAVNVIDLTISNEHIADTWVVGEQCLDC